MFMDSNRLFSYAREYFDNCREIFIITVMGKELYIVTSAEDVSAIYRNTEAFDFDPIIMEIFTDFGVTSDTFEKMHERNWPHGKHWIDIVHEIFKLQMHPGEKLQKLESTFLSNIDSSLAWHKLRGDVVLSEDEENGETGEKVVSLFRWCYQVLWIQRRTQFLVNRCIESPRIC
ncbi:hypothetical protein OCU04_007646 [Sclerotinia nivalis]|uniref:Uncharacterized protein n=1 Tax=Sclerotinia nivalis TaxID=352851 RepID=A0A9X0AJ72_9HELO|nr:hypothetical protein OCU04_007646 [Sclerotinia nivalis]